MSNSLEIMFLGATETVTGSCTALKFSNEKETHFYLVDIGEYQSEQRNEQGMAWLAKNAKRIEGIFVTHAHYDHVGYLPELVMKYGFTGTIYCTIPTGQLMKAILEDSLKIKGSTYCINEVCAKIKFCTLDNFTGKFYTLCDDFRVTLLNSAHILGSMEYTFNWKVNDKWGNITFSGDIGSNSKRGYSNILLKEFQSPYFNSETGRINIVLESTYGNRIRNKENLFDRKISKLTEILKDAHANNRPVIIPAFALNRSQEILLDLFYFSCAQRISLKNSRIWTLNKYRSITGTQKTDAVDEQIRQAIASILKDNGFDEAIGWKMRLCDFPENIQLEIEQVIHKYSVGFKKAHALNVKTYSNLMSKINKIYREHILTSSIKKDGTLGFKYLSKVFFEKFELSNLSAEDMLKQAKDLIDEILSNALELKKIDKIGSGFQIIVSSSGMCDDGKVMELLKKYLPDENAVIILTGYQAKNTNGYYLKNLQNYSDIEKLNKELYNLDGLRLFEVKCKIIDLSEFYSGHADQDMLVEYITGDSEYPNNYPTKVFLNHGQADTKDMLKERLELQENIKVEIPEVLHWYNLDTWEQYKEECKIEQKNVLVNDIKRIDFEDITILVPNHYDYEQTIQKIKNLSENFLPYHTCGKNSSSPKILA